MSAPLSAAIRAAFPKLAQQKDDAVIIDVLIHIGTSFLNFALRHKYEDRPGDKEGVNAGRSED